MSSTPQPTPQQTVVISVVEVPVAQEPIVVRASGDLSFNRGAKANPTLAHMLIFDERLGAYRAILTPPGTSWELVEKRQGPRIWKPGERRT